MSPKKKRTVERRFVWIADDVTVVKEDSTPPKTQRGK